MAFDLKKLLMTLPQGVESPGLKRSLIKEEIPSSVNSQDDLLEEATEFMGENADDWVQRKPDFYRSPDGKFEIEISSGHPHMGEGPHVKIMVFDPTKGKKGGFRVIEKIFTESGR